MRRLLLLIAACAIPMLTFAQGTAISREDGFVLMWNSLHRPVEKTSETPYADMSTSDDAYATIRFAKSRNILGDVENFHPHDSLTLDVALTWLFRTRNIDDPQNIIPDTLSKYLTRYPIATLPADGASMPTVTEDQVYSLMQSLDTMLDQEVHEVSLYSENFQGAGTAFGEKFDMYAMTAAHRTFPYNTLVKVTNVDNGQSVTVRINDRGPYVKGRDMDLSLGAFTTIADRSKGVIHATFQRLGDVNLVGPCATQSTYQQRLYRTTILRPGIPHVLPLGQSMTILSNHSFVVRSVTYPDGNVTNVQDWVLPGDHYTLKPSTAGDYTFVLNSADGHSRSMTMTVAQCN